MHVYPLVEEIFSQAIPNLFTPVTPTRCVANLFVRICFTHSRGRRSHQPQRKDTINGLDKVKPRGISNWMELCSSKSFAASQLSPERGDYWASRSIPESDTTPSG